MQERGWAEHGMGIKGRRDVGLMFKRKETEEVEKKRK
jgi:hypothetical protein